MAYDLLNLDGEVFRYEVETQAGRLLYICILIHRLLGSTHKHAGIADARCFKHRLGHQTPRSMSTEVCLCGYVQLQSAVFAQATGHEPAPKKDSKGWQGFAEGVVEACPLVLFKVTAQAVKFSRMLPA